MVQVVGDSATHLLALCGATPSLVALSYVVSTVCKYECGALHGRQRIDVQNTDITDDICAAFKYPYEER